MITNEINQGWTVTEPSNWKIKQFIHDKLRIDYKLSIENNSLFYNWSAIAIKDGREVEFTIQLRDMLKGYPDCKIGNFLENFYMRPDSQCKKEGKRYNTFRGFQHAVIMCLRSEGWKFIKWVDNSITI